MAWAHNDPRWLTVEKVLAVLMLLLFMANILAWQGVPVFGSGPQFRPLALVYFTGSLFLQSLASLARRRSFALSYGLLAVSIAALWYGFTLR